MSLIQPLIGGNTSQTFTPPIEQSLIFDGAAYLSWTPGSAGNRKVWTWAGWIRRSRFGIETTIFGNSVGIGASFTGLTFSTSDTMRLWWNNNVTPSVTSTAVFRDVGWYHVAIVAEAVTSNTVTVYVNGAQVMQATGITTDGEINNTSALYISDTNASFRVQGALADIHFLDGTALSQAQIQSTFLQDWPFDGQSIPAPKAVSGLTYGTNGFHLAFADTSAFGDDTSGNTNDWTPTGFVAGDQSSDVPGRPYALFNGLNKVNATIGEGGRRSVGTGTTRTLLTLPIPETGQWACNFKPVAIGATNVWLCGIFKEGGNLSSGSVLATEYLYRSNGQKGNNGAYASYGSSFTTANTITVAYDADAGELDFFRDGVSQGVAYTGLSGKFFFAFVAFVDGTNTADVETGEGTLTQAFPTGFLPLSTDNLPTPLYAGKNWFDANIRTGTGAAYNVTTGPANGTDLVWTKGRSGATDHALYDIVRGVQQQLESNNTNNETTEATGLTAFNSTGYSGGSLAQINTSAATYVDWMWAAGGTPVSNTDGTVTSSVSAASAGHFSIASWNGTNAAGTVGHGLPGTPELTILKTMSGASAYAWVVLSPALLGAGGPSDYLYLNSTIAEGGDGAFTGGLPVPGASTISLPNTGLINYWNATGFEYLALNYRSVPGLCKVGSYTGNGSADGPLIDLGFPARWIMIKSATQSSSAWYIYDTARQTINVMSEDLLANSSAAEPGSGGGAAIDILSSAVKHRSNRLYLNNSGSTYIYLALAELAGGGDLPWPLAR